MQAPSKQAPNPRVPLELEFGRRRSMPELAPRDDELSYRDSWLEEGLIRRGSIKRAGIRSSQPQTTPVSPEDTPYGSPPKRQKQYHFPSRRTPTRSTVVLPNVLDKSDAQHAIPAPDYAGIRLLMLEAARAADREMTRILGRMDDDQCP